MVNAGDLLWVPSEDAASDSGMARFTAWLKKKKQLDFTDYHDLWQWSVDNVEDFWQAIWEFFEVQSSAPYECVLRSRKMPGAEWFPGARLNYARRLLSAGDGLGDQTAIYAVGETSAMREVSWNEVKAQVFKLATAMRAMGVQPGDTVAAYLPNIPEAMVAFLATASIGAVWSSCSPDFGADSVLDRFAQIKPKVLFAVDGYVYGGKTFDRRPQVRELADKLTSLKHLVYLPGPVADGTPLTVDAVLWDDLLASTAAAAEFEFTDTGFNDPLWVVYSSGTTGPPKPFVHGHGGIILEGLKFGSLQLNLNSESCLFFFTTTGWIMWNLLTYGLLNGAAVLMVDGNPMAPEPDSLWQHAADAGATLVGASPAFINQQIKLGIKPKNAHDMSRVSSMLVSGSPISPEQMLWCYQNVQEDLWLVSTSGGTDIASGFVGGSPTLPIYAGEIQTRCLGIDVHALNAHGEPVINEVGELVVRKPMPSMPLYFWGDEGYKRYQDSYFDVYPGMWCHGDFLKVNERGGCFILGRSDSTLNRHGIRIGTAEIYRVLDDLDEIADSIIVNLDLPGGHSFMPLFVVMPEGEGLTDAVRQIIKNSLRERYSPRHVPDKIIQMAAVPYTLTGKKLEVPLRKILMGADPNKVASPDAMQNPESLDYYVAYAKSQQDYPM